MTTAKTLTDSLQEKVQQIEAGGQPKYHEKLAEQNKLFVRERLNLLFDDGVYEEDGKFANFQAGDLPADGVVTAIGKIGGQTVCVMANDSTVKAGSWGARTVEKIIRIQETAEKLKVPLLYLVDSAGCMTPDEVFNCITLTREHVVTPLGFHGHNNLSLAVANSLSAVRAGATFVDSSILGMGRSAGNAQTEVLTYLLSKEGFLSKAFDQYKLYDFADKMIAPLMPSKQGLNGDDIHIGVSKFHTSYLPMINEFAEKFDVDKRKLIKEVSDVNCLDPGRELVRQISLDLGKINGK